MVLKRLLESSRESTFSQKKDDYLDKLNSVGVDIPNDVSLWDLRGKKLADLLYERGLSKQMVAAITRVLGTVASVREEGGTKVDVTVGDLRELSLAELNSLGDRFGEGTHLKNKPGERTWELLKRILE